VTAWRERLRPTALAVDLEQAHRHAVGAAEAGLQDAGLGPVRLSGPAVPVLADAAVTSATPFLRAPLLARLSRVRLLHPPMGRDGRCPSCAVPAPCATAVELAE
jgi:soluble lytic murein transglycosylase-like protein